MDRERFDAIIRLLATPGSRRQGLGALLGAALIATAADVLAKPGKRRAKGRDGDNDEKKDKSKDRQRRHRQRARVQAAAGCCSSGACAPGPGKNLTSCCYEGQNLAGKSFKGSNLTNANFTGAILTNAKFQSSNLSGACLVDADITGANFKGANLSGVIKCRTITSTGVDNSGCSRGTDCCRTCVPLGEPCAAGAGEDCCEGAACLEGICGGPPPDNCGGAEQPCCEDENGLHCDPGFACFTNGISVCVACGGTDEFCCPGEFPCEAGHVCRDNRCRACGANTQPCCLGQVCNPPLTCFVNGSDFCGPTP